MCRQKFKRRCSIRCRWRNTWLPRSAPFRSRPQQILGRAQQQSNGNPSVILILCLLVCLPLVALTAGVLYNAVKPAIDPAVVARNDVEEKSNKDKSTPKDEPSGKAGQVATTENGTEAAVVTNNGAAKSEFDGKTSAAKSAAAKPPAVLPDPWHDVIAQAGELPTFAETSFVQFDREKELPRRDTLARWFAAVPGQNHNISEARTRDGACGVLNGFARLKVSLDRRFRPQALALELSRLATSFFQRRAAASTLVYYEENGPRWFAYSTMRKPGDPKPSHYAIAATDDDRSRRTELAQRRSDGNSLPQRRAFAHAAATSSCSPLLSPVCRRTSSLKARRSSKGSRSIRTRDYVELPPESPRPVRFETSRPADLSWTSTKPELLRPAAGRWFAACRSQQPQGAGGGIHADPQIGRLGIRF